jgi:hypothetical protein
MVSGVSYRYCIGAAQFNKDNIPVPGTNDSKDNVRKFHQKGAESEIRKIIIPDSGSRG